MDIKMDGGASNAGSKYCIYMCLDCLGARSSVRVQESDSRMSKLIKHPVRMLGAPSSPFLTARNNEQGQETLDIVS